MQASVCKPVHRRIQNIRVHRHVIYSDIAMPFYAVGTWYLSRGIAENHCLQTAKHPPPHPGMKPRPCCNPLPLLCVCVCCSHLLCKNLYHVRFRLLTSVVTNACKQFASDLQASPLIWPTSTFPPLRAVPHCAFSTQRSKQHWRCISFATHAQTSGCPQASSTTPS